MNAELFQLLVILSNALGVLAWRSMRQQIAHVKELLTLRLDDQGRRIETLETK